MSTKTCTWPDCTETTINGAGGDCPTIDDLCEEHLYRIGAWGIVGQTHDEMHEWCADMQRKFGPR